MNRPICLFDSGLGGLSVLKECLKRFPNEDYLYFADEKFCPYGNRKDDFIIERVEKITKFFSTFNPKATIIACNTASRFYEIAKTASCTPIIEIVTPTVKYLKTYTKVKKLLVLATKSTKDGGLYQSKLNKVGIFCQVMDCGFIVPYAENLNIDEKDLKKRLLAVFNGVNFGKFDAILYACTHFSFADRVIKSCLPISFKVTSSEYCAVNFIKENYKIVDFEVEKKEILRKIKVFTNSSAFSLRKKLNYYGFDENLFEIFKIDI